MIGMAGKLADGDEEKRRVECREILRLRDAPTPLVARTKMYVAILRKLQDTSKVMAYLSSNLRLPPQFHHLKRIRRSKSVDESGGSENDKNVRLEILLFPETTDNAAQFEKLAPLIDEFGLETQLILVPTMPPDDRKMLTELNKVWPAVWRKQSDREPIAPEDIAVVKTFMQIALKEAEAAASRKCPAVGAVIFEPKRQVMIAKAGSSIGHPLGHATIQCVAAMSRKQRCAKGVKRLATGSSNLGQMSLATASSDGDEAEIVTKDAYLCTGFDIVLTSEPCVMCSMALIHSRIRRVYYALPNAENGALGSNFCLHRVHEINHHFRVFEGVLEHDCAERLRACPFRKTCRIDGTSNGVDGGDCGEVATRFVARGGYGGGGE
eukprot:g3548.t1